MEKTHVRQLHLSMSCSATGCEFDVNESNHIRCTLNKVFSTETHARHSLVKATGKVWMQHSGSTQERRMDSTRRAEGGIVEGWLMSWDLKKKKNRNSMNEPGWKVIQGRLEPCAKQGKSEKAWHVQWLKKWLKSDIFSHRLQNIHMQNLQALPSFSTRFGLWFFATRKCAVCQLWKLAQYS